MEMVAPIIRCGESRDLKWENGVPTPQPSQYYVELSLFGTVVKVWVAADLYQQVQQALVEYQKVSLSTSAEGTKVVASDPVPVPVEADPTPPVSEETAP